MENAKLIWKIENGNGFWICSCCGAIYNQPQNWKPYANWCMKCRVEWA